MISKSPSIRDLARALGVSATTVSQALRDIPHVKLATRKRIQAAAKAAGYQSNPLAGTLMTAMRRRRGEAFQGTIAIIDFDGTAGRSPPAAAYHRELFEGAGERAAELGFRVAPFQGGAADAETISNMLRARGIFGALILPVWNPAILRRIDWSRCAAVYADYSEEQPALHAICPDHPGSMQMTLRRLRGMGYRRPGLVLEQRENERLCHRWEHAFAFFRGRLPMRDDVPALVTPDVAKDAFSQWFRRHNPDVVIAHDTKIMNWMAACGARVPFSHGFFCLNTVKNPDVACAGLDLQPQLIGARGVELVIGQLQRGEFGVPEYSVSATISAAWVEGATLRENAAGHSDCAMREANFAERRFASKNI